MTRRLKSRFSSFSRQAQCLGATVRAPAMHGKVRNVSWRPRLRMLNAVTKSSRLLTLPRHGHNKIAEFTNQCLGVLGGWTGFQEKRRFFRLLQPALFLESCSDIELCLLYWSHHVRRFVSANAPAGDSLHRPDGLRTEEIARTWIAGLSIG